MPLSLFAEARGYLADLGLERIEQRLDPGLAQVVAPMKTSRLRRSADGQRSSQPAGERRAARRG